MNFRLHKINMLSGPQASVYTILPEGGAGSLFDQFLQEYRDGFPEETKDLLLSLQTIGHKTGARAEFFKKGEGRIKDHISAMFDDPDRKLRLYCIQFGMDCIILGGGGPKTSRTWQDDPNLTKQMELLMMIADRIHERFAAHDLQWAPGMRDITGNLDFREDEDDQS
jgi:hypothetical protein